MAREPVFELMRVAGDYHTHTIYSEGRGTVAENVAAADARGLLAVGISDHGPASTFGIGVRTLDTFNAIRAEIDALRPRFPKLQILLGVEANVVSPEGDLDIPLAWFDRFDYVMAGLHLYVRPRRIGDWARYAALNLAAAWSPRSARRARELNTLALIRAVERYPIDVVTHPGFQLPIDTVALASACARRGVALEINTAHGECTPAYVRAAAAAGVEFVIGSDAHSPARVGDLARGLAVARAAGLDPARLRNVVGRQAGWAEDGRRGEGEADGGGPSPRDAVEWFGVSAHERDPLRHRDGSVRSR